MNKAELILEVQKFLEKSCSKAEAERVVNAVINAIKSGIKKDKIVQIIGFGTFKVTKRKARKGINPRTGESLKIPAKKVVSFKAGSKLKEAA